MVQKKRARLTSWRPRKGRPVRIWFADLRPEPIYQGATGRVRGARRWRRGIFFWLYDVVLDVPLGKNRILSLSREVLYPIKSASARRIGA